MRPKPILSRFRALSAFALAIACAAATASAASAEWEPSGLPWANSVLAAPDGSFVLTQWGRTSASRPEAKTQTVWVRRADGSVQALSTNLDGIALGFAVAATTFGKTGIAVAGTNRVFVGDTASDSLRQVGLASWRRQEVLDITGNAAGRLVLLSRHSTPRQTTRSVWLRSAGAEEFGRSLTVKVRRGATPGARVALGPKGDLLLAWEAPYGDRTLFARYRDSKGRWGSPQRLGIGAMSTLQIAVGPDGRQLIAWRSGTKLLLTSALSGALFPPATTVAKDITLRPGFARLRIPDLATDLNGDTLVRLLMNEKGRAVIVWTDTASGGGYGVRVANVVAGSVSTPQQITPSGQLSVLANAAIGADGTLLVLTKTGDPSIARGGGIRTHAHRRPAGASQFETSEPLPADLTEGGYHSEFVEKPAAVSADGSTMLVGHRSGVLVRRSTPAR